MRLSVITPTFNLIDEGREATFRQAVQSVRDQTHDAIEHLVIDGGSKDGTVDMLETMKAEGAISDFVSQPDTGIYDAMNRGGRMATGDYILYLNSDDYYHRKEGMADVAAAAEKSRPGFICSPIVMLDEPPYTFRVSRYFFRVLAVMPFGHPGMAVRKDVFDSFGGFDETFRISADYNLIARLITAGVSSEVLEDAFASFRPGGVSEDRAARDAERVTVLKGVFGKFAEIPDEDWRWYVARRRFPTRVLLRMLIAPGLPGRMRGIAALHLLRNVRPGKVRT